VVAGGRSANSAIPRDRANRREGTHDQSRTCLIADQELPAEGAAVTTEEFSADGVVYERDGVRVTAFEVDHGAEIKPAYGYRINYSGRSVLISGDTRFSENLIRMEKVWTSWSMRLQAQSLNCCKI
jgi:ribonuclease BN (tRNA processing enzyme)